MGILKVSKNGCKVILEKYKKYKKKVNTANKQIHDFLNFLIKRGVVISSTSIKGKYMEIDTFNDYKLAKKMFKK